jgi:anaerobic C4-dicarboxylate transporter
MIGMLNPDDSMNVVRVAVPATVISIIVIALVTIYFLIKRKKLLKLKETLQSTKEGKSNPAERASIVPSFSIPDGGLNTRKALTHPTYST